MANIRGNPTAGAAAGSFASMHLNPELPPSPHGSDTKSARIEAVLNTFLVAGRTDIATYNKSVDALRTGLTQAAEGVTQTDQNGATTVANSAEVFTT